ncbi:acyl-CoA-like ligand-binding transcription factor [Salinifilum ghardaiensis]
MDLRERKKALTRAAIEDTAIRLFTENGYDATPIDAVCEEALVSRRTFFRYYTAKEDVVLGRSRDAYALAEEELHRRPDGEPYRDSVCAAFRLLDPLFDDDRERQLQRVRLLTEVPALAGPFLSALAEFEALLAGFLAERSGRPRDDARVRLGAAAATTAFRVAVEIWRDHGGEPNLAELAQENLDRLLPAEV